MRCIVRALIRRFDSPVYPALLRCEQMIGKTARTTVQYRTGTVRYGTVGSSTRDSNLSARRVHTGRFFAPAVATAGSSAYKSKLRLAS
jgi:hypothetical protein